MPPPPQQWLLTFQRQFKESETVLFTLIPYGKRCFLGVLLYMRSSDEGLCSRPRIHPREGGWKESCVCVLLALVDKIFFALLVE